MQRVHAHAGHHVAGETFRHSALFARAREEHQDIALGGIKRFANHARGGRLYPLVAARRAIVGLDGKHAALAAQHWRGSALVGQQR